MDFEEYQEEFRAFLYQDIIQNLTEENRDGICYIYGISTEFKSTPQLFEELQKTERITSCNLDSLARMMERINRNDLAKKVRKYQKKTLSSATVSCELEKRLHGLQRDVATVLDDLDSVSNMIPDKREYGTTRKHIGKAINNVEKLLQKSISKACRALPYIITVKQAILSTESESSLSPRASLTDSVEYCTVHPPLPSIPVEAQSDDDSAEYERVDGDPHYTKLPVADRSTQPKIKNTYMRLLSEQFDPVPVYTKVRSTCSDLPVVPFSPKRGKVTPYAVVNMLPECHPKENRMVRLILC